MHCSKGWNQRQPRLKKLEKKKASETLHFKTSKCRFKSAISREEPPLELQYEKKHEVSGVNRRIENTMQINCSPSNQTEYTRQLLQLSKGSARTTQKRKKNTTKGNERLFFSGRNKGQSKIGSFMQDPFAHITIGLKRKEDLLDLNISERLERIEVTKKRFISLGGTLREMDGKELNTRTCNTVASRKKTDTVIVKRANTSELRKGEKEVKKRTRKEPIGIKRGLSEMKPKEWDGREDTKQQYTWTNGVIEVDTRPQTKSEKVLLNARTSEKVLGTLCKRLANSDEDVNRREEATREDTTRVISRREENSKGFRRIEDHIRCFRESEEITEVVDTDLTREPLKLLHHQLIERSRYDYKCQIIPVVSIKQQISEIDVANSMLTELDLKLSHSSRDGSLALRQPNSFEAFLGFYPLVNRAETSSLSRVTTMLIDTTNWIELTDIGQEIISDYFAKTRIYLFHGGDLLSCSGEKTFLTLTKREWNINKTFLIGLNLSNPGLVHNAAMTHREMITICQMAGDTYDHLFVSLKNRLSKLIDEYEEIKCGLNKDTDMTDRGLNKSRRSFVDFNIGKNCVWLSASKQKLSFFDIVKRGHILCNKDMANDEYEVQRMKKGVNKSEDLYNILFNNFTVSQHLTVAPFKSLRQHFDKFGTQLTQDDRMRYEGFRLGTFNRTMISASSILLAAAGFFATGNGDETRCFSCRVTHSGWGRLDRPFEIHRRISPGCHFISGHDSSNIPIHSNKTPLSNESEGRSAESPNSRSASSLPNNSGLGNESSTRNQAQSQAHGGLSTVDVQVDNAKHPNYQLARTRMESFKDWPLANSKRPADLVPAGFFYAGYGDCVRCFCCGVGLRTLSEEDDPWREHINRNESCQYVRRVKGQSFIEDTLSSTGGAIQNSPVPHHGPPCDDGDTLSRPVCKKLLEMGFARDEVLRNFKSVETNQDPNSIQLETILEKLVSDAPQDGNAVPGNQTSSFDSSTPHSAPSPLNGVYMDGRRGEIETMTQGDGYPYRSLDEGYWTLNNAQSAPYNSPPDGADPAGSHSMPVTRTTRTPSASLARRSMNRPSRAVLTTLSEETRELRESGLCKICLDDPANIVFLPCGHLLACVTCTPALERCPLCRSSIRGSVRVHLADMSSVNRRR